MAKRTGRTEGTLEGDEGFVNKVFSLKKIGQLRILWSKKDLTQVQIKKKLNVDSRNSLAGKAKQMKLPRRDRVVAAPVNGSNMVEASVTIAEVQEPQLAIVAQKNLFIRKPGPCLWPIGEPGTKDFRFCNAEVKVSGRTYCEEHHVLAHQKK